MGQLKHLYFIAYDIRHAKRWGKVYHLLQGYGQRIQYSIFVCELSQREREKLRWELEKILASEDSLLLVRLCHRCTEAIPKYNRPDVWPNSSGTCLII